VVTRRAESVPAWAASAATGGVHAAAVRQHSGARLRRHRLHPGGVPGERMHDVLAVSRSPTSRARHVRYVRFRRRPRAYRLGATSRWPCCRCCQPRSRRRELCLGEALHLRLDELDVLDHRRGRHVARRRPACSSRSGRPGRDRRGRRPARERTTQTPFSTNFARTRRPGPGRRSPVRGIGVVRRPHDPIDRVGSVRPQPLSRCRRHTGVGEGPADADADGDTQDSVSPDHRSSTRSRHPADAGCAEGDDPRA
jgi:hypothetical protein